MAEGLAGEIRNPNPEIRRKAEIRIPNSQRCIPGSRSLQELKLAGRNRAGLVCARGVLAGLLVAAVMAHRPLGAQTNTTRVGPPPDRYLLIVETSKTMQRRSDAVLAVVQDMLMSGLNGQVRTGSTLGVWTFNEGLSTGRLPLQKWSASERKDITERTLTFLKGQRYEKQANFDKVVPALSRVISDSRRLTLIVVSSGEWKMRGTPFDERINESFQQWRDQQLKARMPFITILCVTNGQVGAYAVNTPPWPLQLPRLAEEPKKPEPVPIQALAARPAAPTSTVAPLIISGRKPRPEPAPTPKPEPVATQPRAPAPEAAAVATNPPAIVKAPEPAAPPAPAAVAQPVPVVEFAAAPPALSVAEKLVMEPPPKPVPAPLPASEPKPETVKAPAPKAVEPPPAKIEAAPLPAVAMSKPEPVADVQPKPAAAPEVKAQPPVTPAPTPDAAPLAIADATLVQQTNSGPVSPAAPPSARPAPPAQSATAAPAESLMGTRNIVIAAVLLVVVVIGFAVLRMRRPRAAPPGSLITRSIERER